MADDTTEDCVEIDSSPDEIERSIARQINVEVGSPGWRDHVNAAVLHSFEEEYIDDGRPDMPWVAIQWCLLHRAAVADWLLLVLAERGHRIIEMLKAEPEEGVSESEQVGRILGFQGSGAGSTSSGRRAALDTRDQQLALFVAHAARNGSTLANAYALIAERWDVSAATVERAYRANKEFASKMLGTLGG